MDKCYKREQARYNQYYHTALIIAAMNMILQSSKIEIKGIETKLLLKSNPDRELTPDLILESKGQSPQYYVVEIKTSLPYEKEQLSKKLIELKKYCGEQILARNHRITFKPRLILICETSDLVRVIEEIKGKHEEYKDCNMIILEWSQKLSVKQNTDVIFIRSHYGDKNDLIYKMFKEGREVDVSMLDIQISEQGKLLPMKPPLSYMLTFLWSIIFPQNAEKTEEGLISKISINETVEIIRKQYGYFFDLGEWTDKSVKKDWIREAMQILHLLKLAEPLDKKASYAADEFKIKLDKINKKDLKEYFIQKICEERKRSEIEKKRRLTKGLKRLDEFF